MNCADDTTLLGAANFGQKWFKMRRVFIWLRFVKILPFYFDLNAANKINMNILPKLRSFF